MSSDLCINPQPITKRGIQEHNPQIFCIYAGKRGVVPRYLAIREKTQGSALGAIYQKALLAPGTQTPKEWLGKIGYPTGRLRDDPATFGSRTKKEINLDTIREKLAYDLYQEFGRGIFKVPKTRLSSQPVLDDFSTGDSVEYARELLRLKIIESLRIMSRLIEGYQNFERAIVQEDEGFSLSFLEYLQNCHRPPSRLFLEGQQVPLRGLMGLLAVGRILGDTDIIGGQGDNAGFVVVRNSEGRIVAAEVYKIDPGECFNFKLEDPDRKGRLSFSKNMLVNTRAIKSKKDIGGGQTLEDERDLQIAQRNSTITIYWKELTREQKDEFLATLFNCSRYLCADEILKYLFYRDGRFNRSPAEQIPEKIAEEFQKELQAWLELQLEIYHEDLQDFKSRYPEQVLRAEYIDRWGELPLPASDRTFPIRELFTQLTLIETNSGPRGARHSSSDLPERDSLMETQERMNVSSSAISLETLFDPRGQQSAPRKVLLLGRAGIGKSTLCQKIAHDWASGRLWSDRYKAIYWLPLRKLNQEVEQGGCLFKEKDLDLFLAKAVAYYLKLKDPDLIASLHFQLKNHRQEVLVLLDGWDEASPLLVQSLEPLLQQPELLLLLTSRPGVTEPLHQSIDLRVENIGFSKEHVSQYAHNFFNRGERQPEVAQARVGKFLTALQKERNLFTVAHIPLILQMLCVQWEQGADQVGFAPTLAGLYSDMTRTLSQWHCRKEGVDFYGISGQENKEIFSVLGEIALQGLRSGMLIIPAQFVQAALSNTKISEKNLLRTGLLRATSEGLAREYCFLHLTFQEYVIAFNATQKSPQEQRAFIVQHRCKPQFQLVLSLMAGILDTQDPTKEKLKQFFDHLYTAPGDLTGFYQLALTLRCLQQCSDSMIQDWIEDKYHVYNSFLKVLRKTVKKESNFVMVSWVLSCLDFLKGSEKVLEKIIPILFFWRGFITDKIEVKLKMFFENLTSKKSYELFGTIIRELDNWYGSKADVLEELCGKFSTEQWVQSFKAYCQYFKDSGASNEVKKNALTVMGMLCQKCPPDQWDEVFKTLCSFQSDLDPEVKEEVLRVLGNLWASDPSKRWDQMCPVFLNALEEPDGWAGELRDRAALVMRELSTACPPERWYDTYQALLRALIEDPEEDVREHLGEALEEMSKNCTPGRWREVFWSHFSDAPDDVLKDLYHVKERFCRKTFRTRSHEMVESFQQDLSHDDSEIRMVAMWGLGVVIEKLNSKKFTPEQRVVFYGLFHKILLKALQDPDGTVRGSAVAILGKLHKKYPLELWNEIIKVVRPILADPDLEAREGAVLAWGMLVEQCPSDRQLEMVEVLRSLLSDPNASIRINAVWALRHIANEWPAEFGLEAFQALLRLLSDPNSKVRKQAASQLWLMRDKYLPEHWVEIFKALRPLLSDPDSKVRKKAFGSYSPMVEVCKKCPPQQWGEVFEFLLPLLKDPVEEVRTGTIYALSYLNQAMPIAERVVILKAFCNFLMNFSKEGQKDVVNPIDSPLEISPIDNWQEFFEALCHSQWTHLINELMNELCKKLPHGLWHEILMSFRRAVNETDKSVQEKAKRAFHVICQNPPANQWDETFETFCQALSDFNEDVRWDAIWGLEVLCKKIPPHRWCDIFEVASQRLEDEDNHVRDHANRIIIHLSLRSFTENLQFTPKYLGQYFTQIGARKSPLYINRLPNRKMQLACIENNQEITRVISEDEYGLIKAALLENHVLGTYVAQYVVNESLLLDLDPLIQWLRQRVPGNWQAQTGVEEFSLENPEGDSRAASQALLELVQYADRLGLDSILIGRKERRITIKGKDEDIKKLLEGLVAESKDAMQ